MTPEEAMQRINQQLAHIWVVRTFLKHSPEAEDDEELREVPRGLYDYCLALGPSWSAGDADGFLKLARKKLAKLKRTVAYFVEIQPEVSDHTNFRMAAESLQVALDEIERLLGELSSSG